MRSFLRRSHTEARPLGQAEARMCWTCLFHDTQLMSSRGFQTKRQEYTLFSFLLYDSLINVQYSKESSKTNIPVFWVLVPLESRSYSCPRYRFQTHSHLMQPGLSAAEDKIESVSTFVSDDIKFIDTGVKGTAEQLKFNSPQNISEAPEKKLLLTVHQCGGRR